MLDSLQAPWVWRKVSRNSRKIIFRGHRSDWKLCCAIKASDPNKNELCASFCRRFNVSLKFKLENTNEFSGSGEFLRWLGTKTKSPPNPESAQRIIKKFRSEMFSQWKHKNLNPKMFEVTSKQGQWRLKWKSAEFALKWKWWNEKNVKRRNFARVRFYVCC